MYFEPKEGSLGQLTLRLELWKEKSGNDKPIAMTQIEVPEIPVSSNPEEQSYRLTMKGKASGVLVCTVHLEGLKGGKKKQFETLDDIQRNGGKVEGPGSKSTDAGGVRSGETRQTVPSDTSRKRLRIEVHSATGMKSVQRLGVQDPYAVAVLHWLVE